MVTAEPPAGGASPALSVTISTSVKATAASVDDTVGPVVGLTGRAGRRRHPADSMTTAGLIRSVSVAS